MADNVNLSPEEVVAPGIPEIELDPSSSDEGSSTKSSELKTTTDDAATLDTDPSLSSPAKQSSDENSSKKEDTDQSQTSQAAPDGEQGANEEDPLIPRRRVREQAQGDVVEVLEDDPEVIVEDSARRSPTGRPLSSLSQRFEYSTEYIVYLMYKWQAFSLFWSDSKYLVYVQLSLIGVSIANVCIGSIHLHDCPLNVMLPILLTAVGLSGIMVMISRMILVLYKFYTTDDAYSRFLRKVVFAMNCIYLISLTWEFTDYMLCETPSTNSEDPAYCHPFLVSYTKGYNCAAFMIVFISIILHGPAYLSYSWHIGGPGLPDSSA